MTLPHRQALAEIRFEWLARLKKIDKQMTIRLSKNEWKEKEEYVRSTASGQTSTIKNAYLKSPEGQDELMNELEELWDRSWMNIVAVMTIPKNMDPNNFKKGKKGPNERFWAETFGTIMGELSKSVIPDELLDVKLKF